MKFLPAVLCAALTFGTMACDGSPEETMGSAAKPSVQQTNPAPAVDRGTSMQTTDSGLQYEILQEGDGASPIVTSSVTVHYVGTLVDGTEFDSSVRRGTPATFPLNRVIQGWTEGLQLMKEGAKYRFTIPPELGYGEGGVPGTIPGGSTLIFEVELITVN